MTSTEIETAMTALARQLSAQAQSNYSSVKLEINIASKKTEELIRPQWSCYTPVYGWTEGTTLDGAMQDQGNKNARKAELLAKAKELMDLAATLGEESK